MKDSKLIAQLKLLTAEEFKQFYIFLRSPYFTQSKEVIKLFEVIRKYYPTFLSDHLKKEKLYKKLFPQQIYSDIKLRNLQSKLSKILESYLIQISYEQDKFGKKKKLTQIYGARNYYSGFKKGTEKLLTELEKQPYRDADYYFEKYLLQKAYYLHVGTPKQGAISKTLVSSLKNLEYFFGLERLFLGIDLKNRENIFAEKSDFEPNAFPLKLPSTNILYQQFQESFLLIGTHNQVTFNKLFSLFITNLDNVRPTYNMVILIILLNEAMRLTKQGKPIFLDKLFYLYKVGLEKKLLFEKGKIPTAIFLNAIMVSAKLKEFDWAEQFIENNRAYLMSSKENEVILQLSISNIRLHQKKYEEVIQLLSTINLHNIRFELFIRNLLIRAYFKLMLVDDSYYSSLVNHFQAFEKFLMRDKKLDTNRIKGNKKFLKILQEIVDLILIKQFFGAKKIALQTQIKQSKNMPYKGWLLASIFEENG